MFVTMLTNKLLRRTGFDEVADRDAVLTRVAGLLVAA
jgi:hypothetical protein